MVWLQGIAKIQTQTIWVNNSSFLSLKLIFRVCLVLALDNIILDKLVHSIPIHSVLGLIILVIHSHIVIYLVVPNFWKSSLSMGYYLILDSQESSQTKFLIMIFRQELIWLSLVWCYLSVGGIQVDMGCLARHSRRICRYSIRIGLIPIDTLSIR